MSFEALLKLLLAPPIGADVGTETLEALDEAVFVAWRALDEGVDEIEHVWGVGRGSRRVGGGIAGGFGEGGAEGQ